MLQVNFRLTIFSAVLTIFSGLTYAETGVNDTTITIGMSSPLSGPNGACCRRPKIDPPRRLNIDPGRAAVFGTAAVDKSTKQLLGALLFSLLYRQMHKESAKRIAIPCALA
jgi:hypothetical protein